jgi:hypothetical protein
MPAVTTDRAYSVSDLAQRWACKPHGVLALIASGDLKALDISVPGSKRPH